MSAVFVVDRAGFFGGDWPQGFVAMPPTGGAEFLAAARRAGRYEPRELAERTPAWKQWIPYCVLRCGVTEPAGRPAAVFRVQRTSGQSETRLHGLWSIGLGGHVEPFDEPGPSASVDPESFFERALRRELDEELTLPPAAATVRPRFVGVLNDDATPVGAVHAGLVYLLDLPGPFAEIAKSAAVRETSKMRGGFGSLVELANLWQTPSRFESWSQFLIQAGLAGPMVET
ncbi:MAG: hypothetical protein KDE27_17520 [Planctomycetes bacterium]|nr:hypothetical protein [Planctomycetota bacterium]